LLVLGNDRRGVLGSGDRIERAEEGLALDEAGIADGEGREELKQFLGGSGLELEEVFEIPASPMGAAARRGGAARLRLRESRGVLSLPHHSPISR
jgi:hypothetical protein